LRDLENFLCLKTLGKFRKSFFTSIFEMYKISKNRIAFYIYKIEMKSKYNDIIVIYFI